MRPASNLGRCSVVGWLTWALLFGGATLLPAQVESEELADPAPEQGADDGGFGVVVDDRTDSQADAAPTRAAESELESLAEQRYLDGDLEAASQLYQQLAGLSTAVDRKTKFLLSAAWLEHQLERPFQAKALLTEALVLDPGFELRPENYTQDFVELYTESQQQAEAERQNRVATLVNDAIDALSRGDQGAARSALQTALDTVPNHPTALYNLAVVEQRSGREDEAIANFEKLLALQEHRGALTTEVRAQTRSSLGMLYYNRGFWDDAKLHLGRAVELDPDNAKTWNNLGLAEKNLGDADAAERAFRKAVELEPDNPQIANNLAVTLIRGEKYIDAVALLLETTRLHPSDTSAWLNLALAQRGMGNLDGARESVARAIQLDPQNQQGAAARASTYLAIVQYQRGDYPAAVAAARQAIAWSPEDVDARIYAGLAQQAMGDYQGARQSFEAAISLDPDRPSLHNNLGTAFVALGDYTGAEAAFRKALSLDPGFQAARDNLDQVAAHRSQGAAAGGGATPRPAPTPQSQPSQGPRQPKPLGVEFSSVDYGALGISGVGVEAVTAGSPAAAAGILPGDIILRADGAEIESSQQLLTYLYQQAPSNRVVLDLMRAGQTMKVTVSLD